MTNNGLQFEAKLVRRQDVNMLETSNYGPVPTYLCLLNCVREGNKACLISPSVRQSKLEFFNTQNFSRVGCGSLETLDLKDIVAENVRRQNTPWSRTIFVQQPQQYTSTRSRNRGQCTFRINFQRLLSCGFSFNKLALAESELGYWVMNAEDGLLVLKLFNGNDRAEVRFEKLELVVELEVSCQGDPCFFLRFYPNSFVDPEITKAMYLPSSGFSFKHSRRGGEEHCRSSKIVLMVLKKKFPSRQYFDVELAIRDSKDKPLGKAQETNPVKGL
jgi:hypothetical protein